MTSGVGLDGFFAKKSQVYLGIQLNTLSFIVPAVTTGLTSAFMRAMLALKGEAKSNCLLSEFSSPFSSVPQGVSGMSGSGP